MYISVPGVIMMDRVCTRRGCLRYMRGKVSVTVTCRSGVSADEKPC